MTLEAQAAAICADAYIAQENGADLTHSLIVPAPANDTALPGDPELGWATANPDKALLFLYVSPRPCAALDELMAL